MKREEALYLLKEVYAELIVEHPELKIEVYRDGGSIAFSIPSEPYRNIVMLAKVNYEREGDNRVVFYINRAIVLKEGCVMFTDTDKDENIVGNVSLENRNFMRGDGSVFDRNKTKRELLAMVRKRLTTKTE